MLVKIAIVTNANIHISSSAKGERREGGKSKNMAVVTYGSIL
jgi:hypothetical protein